MSKNTAAAAADIIAGIIANGVAHTFLIRRSIPAASKAAAVRKLKAAGVIVETGELAMGDKEYGAGPNFDLAASGHSF